MTFRQYGGTTYNSKHNYISGTTLSLSSSTIREITSNTITTDTLDATYITTDTLVTGTFTMDALNINEINANITNVASESPFWKITSSGEMHCIATYTMSDHRIKSNISREFAYSVDDIKPVSYYNKLTKKNECGVLAHELQDIYPDLVSGIKDDAIQYQTVNYTSLVAILIKEVQDLKKANQQLKGSII